MSKSAAFEADLFSLQTVLIYNKHCYLSFYTLHYHCFSDRDELIKFLFRVANDSRHFKADLHARISRLYASLIHLQKIYLQGGLFDKVNPFDKIR